MLGLGTGERGRRVLFAAWMCRMAVVLAAARATGEVKLYPLSPYCTHTHNVLHCNATDDKTYKLDNSMWKDIGKVIIHNAPVLVLEDPLCATFKREVEVHNSNSITTDREASNCSQQVIIHDSQNVRLIDGVDLVRMFRSEADEITLPRVSQFDLTDSVVKKVSVRVDGKMSTIENSKIKEVKAMVVEGDFQFTVENSTLGKVEGFKYNSTSAEATFGNALLESVAGNGFVVEQGTIKIQDSQIGSVAAKGLAVEGGSLVIVNSVLHYVAFNSIVVSKGGSVTFENVTVAGISEIYFTISRGTKDLFPLALLGHIASFHSNIWVVVLVGFVMVIIGLLVGAGVMYYYLKRRGVASTEVDTTQLLKRNQQNPIYQPDSMPSKSPDTRAPKLPNNKNDKNKNTPALPLRQLPTTPQKEEMYEQYSDVAVQPPTNNKNDKSKNTPALPIRLLPTPPQKEEMYEQYSDVAVQRSTGLPPHRPPVPVPPSEVSTLPMIPNWRDPKGADMDDERNRLPPPPPPDDEIYDAF